MNLYFACHVLHRFTNFHKILVRNECLFSKNVFILSGQSCGDICLFRPWPHVVLHPGKIALSYWLFCSSIFWSCWLDCAIRELKIASILHWCWSQGQGSPEIASQVIIFFGFHPLTWTPLQSNAMLPCGQWNLCTLLSQKPLPRERNWCEGL